MANQSVVPTTREGDALRAARQLLELHRDIDLYMEIFCYPPMWVCRFTDYTSAEQASENPDLATAILLAVGHFEPLSRPPRHQSSIHTPPQSI